MSCPDLDTLKALARGDTPPTGGDALLQHVEQCQRCGDLLTKLFDDSKTPKAPTSASDTNDERTRISPADAPPLITPSGSGLSPPLEEGEIGRLGHYKVLSQLGSGGMGFVYRAVDTTLNREVALKVMKPEVAVAVDARKRFLREARAAASLEHDHIVAIYHVGEENGIPYLVMPLLKGFGLDQRLRTGESLTIPEAIRITIEAAEGLGAAHERGLIHRDIKPGNIWIEPNGRVKILDFGLARSTGEDTSLTKSGVTLGTPAYMPLEQARG